MPQELIPAAKGTFQILMTCKGFTQACLINRKNPIRPAHLLSRLFKTLIVFHICERSEPVGQCSEAEDQIHCSFSFFRSLNMKTCDKLWHMHPLQSDDLKIQDLANKGTIEKACSYCRVYSISLCCYFPCSRRLLPLPTFSTSCAAAVSSFHIPLPKLETQHGLPITPCF